MRVHELLENISDTSIDASSAAGGIVKAASAAWAGLSKDKDDAVKTGKVKVAKADTEAAKEFLPFIVDFDAPSSSEVSRLVSKFDTPEKKAAVLKGVQNFLKLQRAMSSQFEKDISELDVITGMLKDVNKASVESWVSAIRQDNKRALGDENLVREFIKHEKEKLTEGLSTSAGQVSMNSIIEKKLEGEVSGLQRGNPDLSKIITFVSILVIAFQKIKRNLNSVMEPLSK